MKQKTIKILYWVFTILFSIFMLYFGGSQLAQIPQSVELMQNLGYPIYVNTILGIAKILGVLALLQWKFKTIKEWAYAGFTFDILGAAASIYFAEGGILAALSTLIFLAAMFISYFLWKKTEKII